MITLCDHCNKPINGTPHHPFQGFTQENLCPICFEIWLESLDSTVNDEDYK